MVSRARRSHPHEGPGKFSDVCLELKDLGAVAGRTWVGTQVLKRISFRKGYATCSLSLCCMHCYMQTDVG